MLIAALTIPIIMLAWFAVNSPRPGVQVLSLIVLSWTVIAAIIYIVTILLDKEF